MSPVPLSFFDITMRGRFRAWTVRSEMGRSRPGKPLLSGESDPVAESRGAGGQALGRRRGRKGLRPSSRGGRARRAAAEYQPGYDGLPGGAQGLRALASMTIRVMITIRTLLGSTKVATKFEGNFQLPKKTTMSRSRRQSRDCCDCCRLRDYDHGVALEAKSMYNLLVLFSEQHAS